jgi:hypothetical protein
MTINYQEMKKISILMMLFVLVATTSCKKSFIELAPLDSPSPANFYQTEAQFRQALATDYVTLRAIYNIDWTMSEERSDNTDYDYYPIDIGKATVDREYIHDFVDDANNTYDANMYTYLYVGVARCNVILANIALPAASAIPAATKTEIRGEAEFLRALYYFKLVQYYGGVPLQLTPVTTADGAFIPRSTAAQVYAQITADATAAIADLPVSTFTSGKQSGAATKGAATMLLADVDMTLLKYPEAETLLTSLSTMGYSLLPSYASVFNAANKNSVESIFEIQYMASATTGQSSNFLYLFLPRSPNTALITNGIASSSLSGGWNYPTQDLINAYEPGDPRLDASIGVAEGAYSSSLQMTISAYKSIVNYTPAAGKVGRPFDKKVLSTESIVNLTDDDWPVYRYAGALLTLAEAQNEQGKATALTSLNAVRARAFGNSTHAITTTDQTQLRAAIAHERRVELAFENDRWHYLQRTGTAVAVMNAFGANLKTLPSHNYLLPTSYNVTPNRLIYPMPFAEIQLNPLLTQNPGY